MKRWSLLHFLFHFIWLSAAPTAWAVSLNGFDLSKTDVPLDEIHRGGPPRDGIPAISNPLFESVPAALFWLAPHDRVLAIEIDSDARAYPLRILNWHEIVNDVVGGWPVVISYCPHQKFDGRKIAAARNNDYTLRFDVAF